MTSPSLFDLVRTLLPPSLTRQHILNLIENTHSSSTDNQHRAQHILNAFFDNPDLAYSNHLVLDSSTIQPLSSKAVRSTAVMQEAKSSISKSDPSTLVGPVLSSSSSSNESILISSSPVVFDSYNSLLPSSPTSPLVGKSSSSTTTSIQPPTPPPPPRLFLGEMMVTALSTSRGSTSTVLGDASSSLFTFKRDKAQPPLKPSKRRKFANDDITTPSSLGSSGDSSISTSAAAPTATDKIVRVVKKTVKKVRSKKCIDSRRLYEDDEYEYEYKDVEEEFQIARVGGEASFDIARLLDMQVCEFEATLLFAPEKLEMFTEIILSVKVFLKNPDFEVITEFDAVAEERDQTRVATRKVALVNIFEKIGLRPTNDIPLLSSNALDVKIEVGDEEEEEEIEEDGQRNQDVLGGVSSSSKPSTMSAAASVKTGFLSSSTTTTELQAVDLQAIYNKAQFLGERYHVKLEPRQGMKYTLREYQKQALAFMVRKENMNVGSSEEQSCSPLWREYALPENTNLFFYFNPFSGELSMKKPIEEHCRGGILADEMGLGKTIEVLSLIHSNPFDPQIHKYFESSRNGSNSTTPATDFSNILKRSKGGKSVSIAPKSECKPQATRFCPATLIVCPLNVLNQWKQEAIACLGLDETRVAFYYGDQRSGVPEFFSSASLNPETYCASSYSGPNLVLTTYHTLASENSDRSSSSSLSYLYQVKWFRVILDEAHYIKERATKLAKSCYKISSFNRWVVTGTPIVNSLSDLFSLIYFLRLAPWNKISFWNAFIEVPFGKKDVRAIELVQTILEPILLRRTKNMKTSDGKPIVELPPKTVKIEYLEFSDDEQEIYSQLVAVSKRRILHLKGIGRVDYTHVFQLVLRLRQVCDHISLLSATSSSVSSSSSSSLNDVSGDEDLKNMISKYIGGANDSKFLDQVTRDLSNQEEKECLICFEPTSSYVLLPCLHYACEDCSNEYFEKKEQRGEPQDCFVCRAPCKPAELQVITKSDSSSVSSTASMINLRPLNFTYSTKLHAIAQNLLKTRKESTRIKTIIFSQWTKMLSVTEVMLNEKGFDFVRLDGTLTAKQRESVLNRFNNDDKVTVLLASLRSAGVGLNLTRASRLILIDPWWNASVENQAIDRVHRIGQTEPVEVTRYIMSSSVEEKMLKIQERKRELAGVVTATGNGDDGADKLKLEDLMAMFD